MYLCAMVESMDGLRPLVLNIGRQICGRDWNYPDVQSPFTRIYLITEGRARVMTPRGNLDLRPGHMYIIPAFSTHSCRCDSSFEHIYIHLYNEGAAYVLEDWDFKPELETTEADFATAQRLMELCPGMALCENDPRTYDNTASMRRLIALNKQRPLADRIESRGLIYRLLAQFIREATAKSYATDRRISAVLRHIRDHLADAPDIETLADIAHTSRDHLIRLFKRVMGTTPRAYINSKRIEQAQLMLITEDIPAKEVAYSLGFEDQAYFNRLFLKHTGMTPLAYRRSAPMSH